MSSVIEDTQKYVEIVTSSLSQDILSYPDNREIINAVIAEQYSEAEKRCQNRIKLDKQDYFVWSFYGLLLMLKGETSKAETPIMRALQIDMDRVLAWNLLGDYHLRRGKEKDGKAAYYLSLDRVFNQIHPRKILYHHLIKERRFESALRALEPVLGMLPDDEDTWSHLRDCISTLGHIEFAEAVIYRLEREFPQKHMTWYLRGNLLFELSKPEDAEIAIRKAIELDSEDARTWELLGMVLNQIGRTEEAVESLEKAVKIEPKNLHLWFTLSLLLMKTGREVESEKAVKIAMKLNPKKAKEILRDLSRNR